MRDIDFEELDRAVNRFLETRGRGSSENAKAESNNDVKNTTISVADQAKSDEKPAAQAPAEIKTFNHPTGRISGGVKSDRQPPRYASQIHRQPPAATRVGRFMDIMPAKAPVANAEPTLEVNQPAKPLKYTARADNTERQSAEIVDGLITRRPSSKPVDHMVTLQDMLETDSVEVEDVVLDSIAVDEITDTTPEMYPINPLVVPDEEVENPPISLAESKESDELSFKEPILNDVNSENSKLQDEILTSGEPGVTEIEEGDHLLTFSPNGNSKQTKVDSLKTIQSEDRSMIKSQPGVEIPAPEDSQNSAEESEEPPLTTPFLPNTRVEKRPLGFSSSSMDGEMMESKIIGSPSSQSKRAKMTKTTPDVPILNRDEYAAPVKRRRKSSGWWVVLAITLIIALGAGGGALVYYLLMGTLV